jgi:uracil phosphoribosyltransferase
MKVKVVDHPLVQHKLGILRSKDTGPKDFRDLAEEISTLLVYEATRNITLEEIEIETPLQKTKAKALLGKKIGIIPILRAGLGMVNGILHLLPAAKIGHIGIYRDHDTLEPVDYYCKLPEDLPERDIIILDPMLATGGSVSAAIKFIKAKGAKGENIKFVCIVSSPEGIKKVEKDHPDIEIYTASIDEKLNDKGYILPGLGDAGDRLYGTM